MNKVWKTTILLFAISLCCSFLYSEGMTVTQKRIAVVDACKTYIGTPYVYGGESKNGIDCSGLIMVTARDYAKIMLPRTVSDIYSYVRIVSEDKRQPGDLVFFKTVNSTVSHVGVYIGKGQFIHAASDGPNTGVIVSSLNQPYWKQRYCGTGTYFPKDNEELAESKSKKKSGLSELLNTTTNPQELLERANNRFPIDLSVAGFFNWNLCTTQGFTFNPRGFSFQTRIEYNRWQIRPGFGFDVRDELQMGIVQIPLIFSITPVDYISLYAGPVFTIGTPHNIESENEIKGSIFPGVMGISFQSPAIPLGKHAGLRFLQDFSYEVFNKTNNSALPFVDSIVAGFAFQTGIKFDIYFNKIEKSQPKEIIKNEEINRMEETEIIPQEIQEEPDFSEENSYTFEN